VPAKIRRAKAGVAVRRLLAARTGRGGAGWGVGQGDGDGYAARLEHGMAFKRARASAQPEIVRSASWRRRGMEGRAAGLIGRCLVSPTRRRVR
jgi:hypothetical protein